MNKQIKYNKYLIIALTIIILLFTIVIDENKQVYNKTLIIKSSIKPINKQGFKKYIYMDELKNYGVELDNAKFIEDVIIKAEQQTGIDKNLILAIIEQESRFNINARNNDSVGLMQLRPICGQDVGVNVYNPEENVLGGARYIKRQIERFGDERNALMAYNAGPSKVIKGKIPSISRGYADRVLKLREKWKKIK